MTEACTANSLPRVQASADAIAYLQTLPYPGNIRELKNLVERTVLMNPPQTPPSEGGELLLTSDAFHPLNGDQTPLPSGGAGGGSLSSMERTAIAASIAKNGGNLSLVAKELGISRGALYRKIEKYGL